MRGPVAASPPTAPLALQISDKPFSVHSDAWWSAVDRTGL
ncbi:hypothetical protein Pd630_LPD07320 [Rhodococcus opacus PD630]|nr:hypothetical protein Pd630_LPD07320 [Rhodococcus opacus PD630]